MAALKPLQKPITSAQVPRSTASSSSAHERGQPWSVAEGLAGKERKLKDRSDWGFIELPTVGRPWAIWDKVWVHMIEDYIKFTPIWDDLILFALFPFCFILFFSPFLGYQWCSHFNCYAFVCKKKNESCCNQCFASFCVQGGFYGW